MIDASGLFKKDCRLWTPDEGSVPVSCLSQVVFGSRLTKAGARNCVRGARDLVSVLELVPGLRERACLCSNRCLVCAIVQGTCSNRRVVCAIMQVYARIGVWVARTCRIHTRMGVDVARNLLYVYVCEQGKRIGQGLFHTF